MLCFWTLSIVLSLSKSHPVCLSKHVSPEIGTSSIDWAQLSRFYLKTETTQSHLLTHFSTWPLSCQHFSICTEIFSTILLSQFSSFFSFLGWGETESTWYVGHWLASCTSPGWWVWSSRWNENWQGKSKYSEEISPSATLCTTNPTLPGLEPGPPRWEAGD
jgi:hypothetical protein